ncbi:MAG: hypothetical protein Fur005_15420 [Roseiflexaceae bacterium]
MAQRPRWVRRFEVMVSILTAMVTILSAIVAWRAAVAGDAAGNADFDGMSAALNREESRILSSADAYQQYRSFTNYYRNNELGNMLTGDYLDQFSDEEQNRLLTERALNWDQTLVDDDFFETRYLNPDGLFDVQRKINESEAEAAQSQDTDPEPHFTRSDRLRAKANLMVGMLIIMASALWFFTMAGEFKHSIRYFFATLGLICMIVGVVGTFVIEVV